MANQAPLLPLRMGTRQRIQRVATRAFDPGATLEFEMPRVGLLAGLFVVANLQVDTSAASVVNARAPWASVNRFTLSTNQGTASIIDVSGYGAFLTQRTRKRGSDYTGDDSLYKQFVAAGALNDVVTKASWFLPVSVNNGQEFDLGMINLQAPEIQVKLAVRCGGLADFGTNVTAVSGNIEVYYLYYEIPDPSRYLMPPLAVVRWLEDSQSINATGEQVYTVPRQGTLLNMIHMVEINGALSDAWDSLALRFNKTDNPYAISQWVQRQLERDRYNVAKIPGVIYWDFFHAYEEVNQGDVRDAIDSEELSTTEAIVNIPSGTVLGANNNKLTTLRRFIQVLE